MILKTSILSILIILTLGFSSVQSQSSVNTAGCKLSGSGGSEDFSLGQVFINSNTGTTGVISEGVQQPFEIFIISNIYEFEDNDLKCYVFPNPVKDNIILKIQYKINKDLKFNLYDIYGKLLKYESVFDHNTEISFHYLPKGTYILEITERDNVLKTFKIIKN